VILKIYFDHPILKSSWGGGAHFLAFFSEFLEKKGHKIVFKLKRDIDLIFLSNNTKELNPKIVKYKDKNPKTKVLHRINECDKRKNTNHIDNLVFRKNKIADHSIFISKWLSEYYLQKGFKRNYEIVYNACNRNYFYPIKKKKLGSKINLVTHHWSDNWMKGFDIYTKLDEILAENEHLSFTFIGRYYKGLKPKNIKLIPPLYGKELGDLLRTFDIYITASRWEPCGMHHIEGACSGLPILYHKEGGGINEACQYYGIEYTDIPTLLDGISEITNSYDEYRNKIKYDFLDSQRCCEEYHNIILNIVG